MSSNFYFVEERQIKGHGSPLTKKDRTDRCLIVLRRLTDIIESSMLILNST